MAEQEHKCSETIWKRNSTTDPQISRLRNIWKTDLVADQALPIQPPCVTEKKPVLAKQSGLFPYLPVRKYHNSQMKRLLVFTGTCHHSGSHEWTGGTIRCFSR